MGYCRAEAPSYLPLNTSLQIGRLTFNVLVEVVQKQVNRRQAARGAILWHNGSIVSPDPMSDLF